MRTKKFANGSTEKTNYKVSSLKGINMEGGNIRIDGIK